MARGAAGGTFAQLALHPVADASKARAQPLPLGYKDTQPLPLGLGHTDGAHEADPAPGEEAETRTLSIASDDASWRDRLAAIRDGFGA